jgi:hypothetical protein
MWLFASPPAPLATAGQPTAMVSETAMLPSTAFPDRNLIAATVAGAVSVQAAPAAPAIVTGEPVVRIGGAEHRREARTRSAIDARRSIEEAVQARPPLVRSSPRYSGSVSIQSEPSGAQVFVNGELAGSTPLVLNKLAVGSRAIRLEAQGYQSWSGVVRTVANEQARVSINLERAP